VKPRVWLVIEIHCDTSPSAGSAETASVWVSGRPLSPDKELADDVARKLIGPLPYSEAKQTAQVLRHELEEAGVEVILDWAADD